MNPIVTTKKKKFLKSEGKIYDFLSKKRFSKILKVMVKKCKKCKVYYWAGCDKRCKCK